VSKRDEIKAEIDKIGEEKLPQLHLLIQEFQTWGPRPGTKGFLEKLQEIKIQGPADWSENLDLYLSGEKDFDANVR
jgi:hypothetical protein